MDCVLEGAYGGGMTDEGLDRNGKRRRQRQADRVASAVEAVVRALEPLPPLARQRVLNAVAVLLDVPAKFALPEEGL